VWLGATAARRAAGAIELCHLEVRVRVRVRVRVS